MNNRTILVVDDQSSHLDLSRTALVDAGYAVETAASGPEALERLRSKTFALVATDQLLPCDLPHLNLLLQPLRPVRAI